MATRSALYAVALCVGVIFTSSGCALKPPSLNTNPSLKEHDAVRTWDVSSTDEQRSKTNPEAIETLLFLIEGDGASWPSRFSPPEDPTPKNPISAHISLKPVESARVIYIGRPCQHLTERQLQTCAIELWTSERFGSQAVALVYQAVQYWQRTFPRAKLFFLGISGGGVMATMLSRTIHMECLVTLGSPLDLEAWTQTMGLDPLSMAVDPLNIPPKNPKMKQALFWGDSDQLVPPWSLGRYAHSEGDKNIALLANVRHRDLSKQMHTVITQSCLSSLFVQ